MSVHPSGTRPWLVFRGWAGGQRPAVALFLMDHVGIFLAEKPEQFIRILMTGVKCRLFAP